MLTNDTEMQMESKIDEQPKTTSLPEEEESVDSNKKQDEQQQKSEHEKMNNSNGLEVAIMLPPPPVLVPFMAATVNPSADTRPRSSSAVDKDEEEGLGLQVLSARSSTPYTVQGVCCANSNCAALEATTDAESNASQWKGNQTELVANGERQTDAINQNGSDKDDKNNHNHLNGHLGEDWKKYSRSDLMDIRNEMTIIRPECLEEARLDRLQFRKSDTGSIAANGMARNKSYRNPNPPNDLMPAFFKRKASTINPNPNAIVYDSFKYNDSNPFSHSNGQDNNYRRIGSGRISSGRQEVNWDYIPEEDPDRHQLPEFFNTKESLSSSKQQRSMQKQKYELDDNTNFAKRSVGNALLPGESSFRSHGSRHSINSSGEERYSSTASSSTANNKSDEPEWFSCGPTSRLDTIELSGFNESDQQKIRLEMSKNKPDSNNNRQDFTANKEKKHLAFQFDDFSTSSHTSKVIGGGSAAAVHAGPKMPASKFMPLFNAKKKDEEPIVAASQNSTQSLNELFMFGGAKSIGQQKEKLSTTDMPSVDEIEAKWRGSIQPNSEAFNNSSENFKKMLHQLNQQQQQQGGIVGTSSMSSPPPATQRMNSQSANNQQQQQPMNLFNNENLSNFIKHRNLQQQLIQKQQQQAAFAQLQFNAILGRPDTQMLLLSLARGEISKHGLVVQLANPNLSQTDREAISAALTFSTVGQFHQQMAINQNNQQQFIANQLQNLSLMQKQLNKSPIGAGRRNANQYSSPRAGASGSGYQQANNNHSGGSSPRTYTHEELQSHANFILHNAMLKKKLEEQNLGLQKMLHLQSTMMQNNNADSMAGTNKNLNHHSSHPYQQQQQQQQQQQKQNHQNMHQQQQQQQRHRKAPSNAATRNNPPIGRRRSTSSSSSNTANSGNMTMNALHNNHLQLRRQLEQRRNTIATATVGGGDDFVQIPQRI